MVPTASVETALHPVRVTGSIGRRPRGFGLVASRCSSRMGRTAAAAVVYNVTGIRGPHHANRTATVDARATAAGRIPRSRHRSQADRASASYCAAGGVAGRLQPMLGAIAAEVRRIRDQMDDALDGQAGRWACESDLTPDNRQTIPCEDNNPGGCIHAGAVARRRSG
jgi:hypothetical protein